MDKVVITTLGENITQVRMRVIFEDSKFYVCTEHLNLCKPEKQFFNIGIYTVTYHSSLIVTAESAIESYALDPSED